MRFYIESGGRALGPFNEDVLRGMIASGTLSESSRVSVDRVDWRPVSEFPELSGESDPRGGRGGLNLSKGYEDEPYERPSERFPSERYPSERRASSQVPPPPPEPRPSLPPTFPPESIQRRQPIGNGLSTRPLNRKLRSRFKSSWIAITVGLILCVFARSLALLTMFALADSEISAGAILIISGLLDAFGAACLGYSFVRVLMFLHGVWASIPKHIARATPDVAIALLFVPGWNLYWLFAALCDGAKGLNEGLAEKGLLGGSSSAVSGGLALAAAICLLFAFPVGVLLLFLLMAQMRRAAEPLNEMAS